MTEAANTSTSQGSSQSSQANDGASNGASGQQSQQQATTEQAAAVAPVRPAELADKSFDAYFDPAKGVKFDALTKDFNDLRSFKAQDDLRKAAVPAKPEEYKLALPQNFEMPKGPDGKAYDFKFDETDPRLAPIRAFAHAKGIDQAGFSELLSIHAQYELGETQQINAAHTAEQTKLGANGPARVDAVTRFLTSKLGTERGSALMDRLMLSSDIEAMEDLVKAFSSQGGANFSQQHRNNENNGKLTEEQYLALPLSERRQYQLNGRAN